ncbi:MAG: glycosyl transferase [Nitrospirales bacterium]|nr:MAG: glycosyl transferase [Nitrospirales bacterium]
MELLGLLFFTVAAVTSLLLTPVIAIIAKRFGVVDHPSGRKVHSSPVPRLGGVSIVCSVIITLCVVFVLASQGHLTIPLASVWMPFVVGSVIVFVVGLWDDIKPLPVWVKFGFQSTAALVAIAWGIRFDRISFLGETGLDIGYLAFPLTFLWIIGITNAFNLVDGLDGLSAGLASIAAGTSAAVFILRGDQSEAILLIIIVGALCGFLRYNFYPAKIFLGDSGSLVIGYVLALTAITGSQKGVTALAILFPLLVFGLPIADTLISMIRRYLGTLHVLNPYKSTIKQKISSLQWMFEPDRDHIHHRLLAVGFSHRGAVLTLYGLALLLSSLGFLTVLANGRNAGLVLALVALATYIGISKLGYTELRFVQAEQFMRLYDRMGLHKSFFLGFFDIFIVSFSFWVAFVLKYEPQLNPEFFLWFKSLFPIVLGLQFGVFYVFGLYRGVWRALSTGDLLRIILAAGAAVVLSSIVALVILPPAGIIGFFFNDFLILSALIVCSRSTYRILDYFRFEQDESRRPALIYGAGKGGQLIQRELNQNFDLGFRAIGFIDDAASYLGCTVNRLPVLGTVDELEVILSRHSQCVLILGSTHISLERIRYVRDVCGKRGIPVYVGQMKLTPLEIKCSNVSVGSQSAKRTPVEERGDVRGFEKEPSMPFL